MTMPADPRQAMIEATLKENGCDCRKCVAMAGRFVDAALAVLTTGEVLEGMVERATAAVHPFITEHYVRQMLSYQDEALHSGDLYRFDGWFLLGKGGGGGRDTRTGRPGRKMKIWAWPPERAAQMLSGGTA